MSVATSRRSPAQPSYDPSIVEVKSKVRFFLNELKFKILEYKLTII